MMVPKWAKMRTKGFPWPQQITQKRKKLAPGSNICVSGATYGIQRRPKHENMVFGLRGSAIQQNLKNHEKVTKSAPKSVQMASQGQKVRQQAPK